MISRFVTYSAISLLKLVSHIPFPILYVLSDILFQVVFHLIRYRRKVVQENIQRAFPEKNPKEQIMLERDYYRWFCDMIIESVKTRNLTERQISQRMVIKNPELVNNFFRDGKSVIVLAMHYGNWEWLLHMPLYLKHKQYFVYKPLSNPVFDRYLNNVREKFGGNTISMSIALRKLIESERDGIPVMTWLAADQAPPWNHPFWTTFLHRETMFFNGPAKLAQRFDQPVIFQHIRRIRRGYYETTFELVISHPREVTESDIITSYVKMAEKVITEDPVCYLWSHRRWKYKRPAGVPLS